MVRLLPVAGVVPGLTGLDGPKLDYVRACHNLRCRALCQGGWSLQPLTLLEASVWLRELLRPPSPASLQNVATHSEKATILSWMSKVNMSLSLRRLLGIMSSLQTDHKY